MKPLLVADDLEGHQLVRLPIKRLEDDPERTLSKDAKDLIPGSGFRV